MVGVGVVVGVVVAVGVGVVVVVGVAMTASETLIREVLELGKKSDRVSWNIKANNALPLAKALERAVAELEKIERNKGGDGWALGNWADAALTDIESICRGDA